ncbi:hypothetical protein M422DRAFT_237125, partial [Sphaerobolus stellatus SS14]
MPFLEEDFQLTLDQELILLEQYDPNKHTPPPDGELQLILKETFNLIEFRAGQLDGIRAVLEGRDTFVRMATGSGKSLIWQ